MSAFATTSRLVLGQQAVPVKAGEGAANLAGLRANRDRIKGSVTSEAQYRLAAAQFEKRPEPPGTLLAWVCRGGTDHLDLEHDRLVLRPA